MMKSAQITMVLIAAVASGCYSADWDRKESSSPVKEAGWRLRPLGEFDVAGSETYKGFSEGAVAARMQLLDGVMDHVDLIREILRSGQDWDRTSSRVLGVMYSPQVSEQEAWFVHQIGAAMVLEAIVDDVSPAPSVAARNAAGQFVEILVGRSSPNAPLIADALDLLKDVWTSDRIRAVAIRGAQAASTYLERCATCKDSQRKQNFTGVGVDDEYQVISAGRSRLLELAR